MRMFYIDKPPVHLVQYCNDSWHSLLQPMSHSVLVKMPNIPELSHLDLLQCEVMARKLCGYTGGVYLYNDRDSIAYYLPI